MPLVKSVTSLAEICIQFVLENQEIFCERFPLGELKEGVDALDSDKPAANPFDELRRLPNIFNNSIFGIYLLLY